MSVTVLQDDGTLRVHRLGLNLREGERPQFTVGANQWFAAEPNESTDYALVGVSGLSKFYGVFDFKFKLDQ
tara:strand:- start:217 stop:429 length:213 start_codon:yes stop_codon:yes gene_type:complete